LLWADVAVGFKVEADINAKILAGIDAAMKTDKKPYLQAARYYFDNGLDLNKALVWATEAVKTQPDAFWAEYLKAQIQLKKGDKKGAIASAQSSMKKAESEKSGLCGFKQKTDCGSRKIIVKKLSKRDKTFNVLSLF
jgi:hypothetical protein